MFSNQKMINAIWAAAAQLGIGGWALLEKAGLNHIIRDRQAPYTGPAIDAIDALTDDEKTLILLGLPPPAPAPAPPSTAPAIEHKPLEGKGWYIWLVNRCEEGEPDAIAAKAQQASLTHVLIKVAHGPSPYRYNVIVTGDRVGPIVSALRGIPNFQVWGWQYIFGEEPEAEARIAVDLVQQYQLDGFVINAEKEFKRDDIKPNAPRYCQALRQNLEQAGLEDLPIALSSYRYPITHSDFSWQPFLEVCTIMMPQVYWVTKGTPDPAGNLESCLRQYEQLGWTGPIIPTGAAYDEMQGSGENAWLWSTDADDIRTFLPAVKAKDLPAVNFWSWQHAGDERWQAVAEFQWD
jgi:hypothetical protein